MLDAIGYPEPYYTQETLAFLETALAKHPRRPAVIFAHCPLYNTVLDRGSESQLDYHTLEPFFAIQTPTRYVQFLGGITMPFFISADIRILAGRLQTLFIQNNWAVMI